MNDKIVEILSKLIYQKLGVKPSNLIVEYIEESATTIDALYSAGEEVSDEELHKRIPFFKPKTTRPTVSEEEIAKLLWYDYAGHERYGEFLNLMSEDDFKAAIKELLNR